MKSISAEKRSSVVSLLNEGHSHHQIQAKTGLGKGTVSRISKEMGGDKENHPGGHPSKLSPMINSQLSVKSALGNLTMLFRPPNS